MAKNSPLTTQPERRMNKADAFIEEGDIAKGRAQRMLQMQDVTRQRREERRLQMKANKPRMYRPLNPLDDPERFPDVKRPEHPILRDGYEKK